MSQETYLPPLNLDRYTGWVLGEHGEALVNRALTDNGYIVTTPPAGTKRGDLRAIDTDTGETIAIEVKTSRRGKCGWAFQLWKRGKTNHNNADVVVCLAIGKSGNVLTALVIPVQDIRDLKSIKVKSYNALQSGKWSRYRQPLHSLDFSGVSYA